MFKNKMLKFGTRAGIRGVRCFSSEGQIAAIKRLAGDYSIEVTPMGAKKIANFGEVPGLLPGQDINVTYLVGSDVNDTYDVCRNLVTAGMKPIAHLPARTFAKLKDVESYLDHLKNDIGVHEVLCIGGGADKPVDQIGDTMQVLESGLLQKYGFEKIGVAAHPEAHPDIPQDVVDAAVLKKAEWAAAEGITLHYCTQFCFEPQPIIDWEARTRAALRQRLGPDKKLPFVTLGVAGPAKISALIKFAQMSGVGASMRFVTKYAGNVLKLATKAAPDELVAGLAAHSMSDDEFLVTRLHYYTFGGLNSTLAWANGTAGGDFELAADQKSFSVKH